MAWSSPACHYNRSLGEHPHRMVISRVGMGQSPSNYDPRRDVRWTSLSKDAERSRTSRFQDESSMGNSSIHQHRCRVGHWMEPYMEPWYHAQRWAILRGGIWLKQPPPSVYAFSLFASLLA